MGKKTAHQPITAQYAVCEDGHQPRKNRSKLDSGATSATLCTASLFAGLFVVCVLFELAQ